MFILVKNKFEEMDRDTLVPVCLAVLTALVALPNLIWYDLPGRDVSRFYASMIREFVAGNWGRAYYPGIPPLFATVGGVLATLFRLDPFRAAQITAILFGILTVFPLYSLHRRVFDRCMATVAVAMFILAPKNIDFIGGGLLTSGKMFFLCTGVLALVLPEEQRWRRSLYLGVATVGLTLVRGEGILVASVLWLILFCCGCWRLYRNWGKIQFHHELLAGLGLAVILITPWGIYHNRMTGFPGTDVRQIPYLKRASRVLGIDVSARRGLLPPEAATFTERAAATIFDRETDIPETIEDMIEDTVKGLNPVYVLLVIGGVIVRIRRKKWSANETLLFTVLAGQMLIFILLDHVIQRYACHSMPLILGWSSCGTLGVYEWSRRRIPAHRQALFRAVCCVIVTASAAYAVIKGSEGAFVGLFDKDDAARNGEMKQCAAWIRENFPELVPADQTPLQSTLRYYHNGRLPVLAGTDRQIAFQAGGDTAPTRFRGRYTQEGFREFCRKKNVNFVIADGRFQRYYPEFIESKDPLFLELYRSDTSRSGIRVFGFVPNLKREHTAIAEHLGGSGDD